jgi:hypothetical protein
VDKMEILERLRKETDIVYAQGFLGHKPQPFDPTKPNGGLPKIVQLPI